MGSADAGTLVSGVLILPVLFGLNESASSRSTQKKHRPFLSRHICQSCLPNMTPAILGEGGVGEIGRDDTVFETN